jgi:hypothetical protein
VNAIGQANGRYFYLPTTHHVTLGDSGFIGILQNTARNASDAVDPKRLFSKEAVF